MPKIKWKYIIFYLSYKLNLKYLKKSGSPGIYFCTEILKILQNSRITDLLAWTRSLLMSSVPGCTNCLLNYLVSRHYMAYPITVQYLYGRRCLICLSSTLKMITLYTCIKSYLVTALGKIIKIEYCIFL
jgi:hypothetical protein